MRILVFQTAFLGDVVLTTPSLRSLKKKYPEAHVAAVVRPAWVPVLQHVQGVDEILTFDKRGEQTGLPATLRFARSLRKKRFDIVLCPHPSFRSGLILWLAGIPRRIGFSSSTGGLFFTERLKQNADRHEVERVLALSGALNISESEWEKQPVIVPDPAIDVQAILERLGIDPNASISVGIHPGSVWATKRWPADRFADVAKAVAARGFHAIVFGTERERDLVEAVVKGAQKNNVHGCLGLSLAELIAVFSKLALYISNDSGPMHIAAALGIPVVALFGSTVPAQGYAPYLDLAAVVETDRLDCRPCGPHGHDVCPLKHFKCMNKLEPETVLMATTVLATALSETGFMKVVMNERQHMV